MDTSSSSAWHPYAAMPPAIEPYMVDHTSGAYAYIRNEYGEIIPCIDAMSSWWAAAFGHKYPALVRAAKEQIDIMPHIMFGGLSHEPAEKLATALIDCVNKDYVNKGDAGSPMEAVFFSDSGSVAVEVAIKMALQYQQGIGQSQRRKMITWKGGYHGDTLGAMSVCDPESGMHIMWKDYVPEQYFLPLPPKETGDKEKDYEKACEYRRSVEKQINEEIGWENLAAFIIEPIVQGAGGMRFHSPQLVREISTLMREKGVLVIFDEIATGFGRSGALFAAHEIGILPDIMCVGKALTGGFMSFAATLSTAEITRGVGTLMHGPTYMANPLACSVALAVLDLIHTGEWEKQVHTIEKKLRELLYPLTTHKNVHDVRVRGAIGVVELKEALDTAGMDRCTRAAMEKGVWIRPFGALLYVMPPYICTEEEIESICHALEAAVEVAAL